MTWQKHMPATGRRQLHIPQTVSSNVQATRHIYKMDDSLKGFLQIAQQDFKAAKLLYQNGFFPHSVFYFGQSVEKTCKYLLIRDGVLSIHELNKKIRHDTRKVFIIFTDYIINQIRPSIDINTISNDKNSVLLSSIFNPIEFIKDLEREIENFKKTKSCLLDLDKSRIEHYLNMLKYFESNSRSQNKYNNFFKSDPEIVVQWLMKYHILDEESKTKILEAYKDEKIKSRFLEEVGNSLKSVHELMRINQILFVLSIVFSSYASDTRYPDDELKNFPSSRFNSSSIIVIRLDDFFKYQEKVLNYLIKQ